MRARRRQLLFTGIGFLVGLLIASWLTPKVLADNRVVSGIASTYGEGYDGYLALPEGRGITVKICSTASGSKKCAVRTSNDAGPSKGMQRQGRIVDLDVLTFEYLCECNWRNLGLMRVTVEYLGRTDLPTPPATSTEEQSWLATQPARPLILISTPSGSRGLLIPR